MPELLRSSNGFAAMRPEIALFDDPVWFTYLFQMSRVSASRPVIPCPRLALSWWPPSLSACSSRFTVGSSLLQRLEPLLYSVSASFTPAVLSGGDGGVAGSGSAEGNAFVSCGTSLPCCASYSSAAREPASLVISSKPCSAATVRIPLHGLRRRRFHQERRYGLCRFRIDALIHEVRCYYVRVGEAR